MQKYSGFEFDDSAPKETWPPSPPAPKYDNMMYLERPGCNLCMGNQEKAEKGDTVMATSSRAGAEEIPDLPRGARPPRRLLLGETFRTLDSDELGRGSLPDELKAMTAEMQKRFLSMRDQQAVFEIMFTDEEDAADFMEKQLGLWDLSGAAQGIVDGVISLMGLASTSTFLDSITAEATSERAVRRAQVAVALEQLGDPDGLSAAMKA